jgi:CRISPR-associated endonuclease Cas1
LLVTEIPWVSVSGHGAHIKSTSKNLLIQKKNTLEEYPLESVKNLLIVGGHSITSSTINHLIRQGTAISFFESDGTAVGTIRPFGDSDNQSNLLKLQQEIHPQRFAVSIAQGSIKSRLFAIERAGEEHKCCLYYEGELELLHKSLDEITYLIKLEEIRRLHRLISDMYYEILSRNQPQELGFRRRTLRPQIDPVNAMLSFGYAMLYGACSVPVIGAGLDPDTGFLFSGRGGLIQDLIEPLKAGMIDREVFRIARESLRPTDYEVTENRCHLSDELIKTMIYAFYTSMPEKKIQDQVLGLLQAIGNNSEFKALY